MIIYIYDIKTLTVVARPIIKDYEEFKAEPTKFYPDWDVTNHISTETEFQNPIMDNGVIREKTREELILIDRKFELLQDGEYIVNNQIVVVDPPYYLYKKLWNKETHIWEEGATLEEIKNEMYRLFDEYIYLDEQKAKYETNKFPTLELENKIAENIMKREYLISINPIII
ncbi:hypothetical protein [Cetobacterium sp.]|uniref:hypothetical protein n=1 Tax=Cetobacterium sp. TaxID=2071632 RepID=UPI003F29FDCD